MENAPETKTTPDAGLPRRETKPAALAPALERMAYSLKEAAVVLGISYITAFRLVQRGLLRSSSALRTKIIARTEIERFLRETSE